MIETPCGDCGGECDEPEAGYCWRCLAKWQRERLAEHINKRVHFNAELFIDDGAGEPTKEQT